MDLAEHRKITAMGLSSTNTEEQNYIHRDWAKYQAIENDVPGFVRRNPVQASQLFTKDLKQLYGAIKEETKGGEKDAPINVPGGVDAFMRTASFQALAKPASYAALAPNLTAETVQALTEAKEIGDMLVLDYLLSQQDRFGNIEAFGRYFYIDAGGALQSELLRKNDEQQGEDMKAKGAVLVRSIFLKSNECGVAKDNIVKQKGLLGMVAHLSPETYHSVLDFSRDVLKPEVQDFFRTEVLFTDADVKVLTSNAQTLASLLQARCRSGALRLDLDLAAFLKTKAFPQDTRGLCE
jgi:hypothetical protein